MSQKIQKFFASFFQKRRVLFYDEKKQKTFMSCGACKAFDGRSAEMERVLPLLGALSSAQGASRVDDGLCRRFDRVVMATAGCDAFS